MIRTITLQNNSLSTVCWVIPALGISHEGACTINTLKKAASGSGQVAQLAGMSSGTPKGWKFDF